jgi:hypothetical protein
LKMWDWLIETLWMNRERDMGLKEYYEVVKKACKGKDGVEFLGLYRPLNEGWNWVYFLKTDSLDKWRELDNEIAKYVDVYDNVTSTMTRIYLGSDQFKQPPTPKKMGSPNYIVEDIQLWAGVDVGLREYYSEACELFDGVEGAWLFGLYVPWSEGSNWTFVYMYDSLSRHIDRAMEWSRRYGRPENLISSVIRIYERYEPN